MKITDSPEAMLAMPLSGTAATGDSELSSTFQPARFTVPAPVFVTSNQSAATGLLPLDHGATSEMIRCAGGGGGFRWCRETDFGSISRARRRRR